jgi:hypothetical protein
VTAARSALLVVLACVVACAFATSGALAQTTGGTPSKDTPEPQAVEPEVGTVAPVQPGATTVPVVPVEPVPTMTGTTGGVPTSAGGAPATAGGVVVVDKSSDDSGGVAWETIAVAVLGALLLFVLIVLLLWRVRGWDPRWLQRWRHAMAEAGWRLSLGWAEFRDFVRLGR